MTAKLERTQRNAQQKIEQNPTIGVTINNESTTTEPPLLRMDISLSRWGA